MDRNILNLFLSQTSEGNISVGCNITEARVSSYRESLRHGGNISGGMAFNLGKIKNSKKIANSIRRRLESEIFQNISEINLHNEGDYNNGKENSLPQEKYDDICLFLRTNPIKIYSEPKIFSEIF